MKRLLIILLAGVCLNAYAQKPPFKFGKIDDEEIAITECDFFPDAHSMILGEYGTISFVYSDSEDQFKYRMEVLVRKKIFNKTDKDAGTLKIRYYEPTSGSSKEEISNLKGYTYNIKNGKVEETKLGKDDKFENRINDYWKEIAVTFPDVQEGSVIEYTYTLTSHFISSLKTWNFQSDIPVKYSELRVTLPEWYNYQVNNVGYYVPLEHEQTKTREEFRYTYKTSSGALSFSNPTGGRSQTNYGSLESQSTYRRFIARNVKPIVDEPYMNNKVDVPNRVEFQLISVKFPNSPLKSIAENYEKFNKQLLVREDFGSRLKKGNFAKEEIQNLQDKNKIEKAAALYHLIQSKTVWNGVMDLFSDKAGTPIIREGKGSVADINLTLVAALREADLDAHPVLISTRGHGIPHPIYPSYDDFNYIVAYVNIDGVEYLADATSELPFGMLPTKCLNGKGWLTKENAGAWVNLKAGSVYQSTVMIQTSVLPDKIENVINLKAENYATINYHNKLEKDGEEKFIESLTADYPEWELNNFELAENSISSGVKYKYILSKDIDDEDILYLQPLMIGLSKENPFNREERVSPIDFEYGYNQRVINTIIIPEGYTAELPEPAIIKLPNNGGSYMFNIVQNGQSINIMTDLKLNQTDFAPQEYPALKQFFSLMVEKNNSLIVLKKI